MICAACGLSREPDDLIAFWPVGYPGRVRFVCRVTRPSPVAQESCFRKVVASRRIHEIAAAVSRTFIGERGPEWIIPATDGWIRPQGAPA